MNANILEKCYEKSIELLLKNSTEFGFLASSKSERAVNRNYLSIFGRDASICALGAVASKNKKLIKTAKNSLLILAKYQADNGKIPNYLKPSEKQANFWKMGCIDATLWWLIAISFYDKYSGDKKLRVTINKKIEKAINWLECKTHPKNGLLVQNEASDWADIMPRSGIVLYSNSLWLKVKSLYKIKDTTPPLRGTGQEKIIKSFNKVFYPYNNSKEDIENSHDKNTMSLLSKKKPHDFYLSYVNYLSWGEDINVYGNSLAIIFNSSKKLLNKKVLKYILSKKIVKDYPIAVLYNPIKKKSKHWRDYMGIHNQNYPYKYHNGGIWPFASSFFVIALAKAGNKKEAYSELERVATLNEKNDWQFNEWFHGKTGRAEGMRWQSWNAGAYIIAYHYLKGNIEF